MSMEDNQSLDETVSLPTEAEMPDPAFAACLADWHRRSARDLPWRRDRDPYHVWVSEIMLQQTTIGAVIGYYERFIRELPTVAALAACPDDRLMKLWEGLGYYSRARHLKEAAVCLIEQGRTTLPADYDALRALPGIGAYTAGAIASMAFDLPYPAVDGNVLRIMARLSACRADVMKTATRRFFEKTLTDLLRSAGGPPPGLFNEGLMELGEVICLPHGEALCGKCPIAGYCRGCRLGVQNDLPVRILKNKRRIEKKTVFLIETTDGIVLHRREDTGLLAGLYEFPNAEGHLSPEEAKSFLMKAGTEAETLMPLPSARHLFSHIEWQMTGYRVQASRMTTAGWFTVSQDELGGVYAVPGAFRAYRKLV